MQGPMRRLRVAVHALDRTGPPVLAMSFVRWMRRAHPDVQLEVVSLRGGPLIDDVVRHADAVTVLEPHEAWDLLRPDPERTARARQRIDARPRPDATLLVSVAAGQLLPIMSETGTLVTWVVEQGEDLHWIDEPTGLRERTEAWLAGSSSSHAEVSERLGLPVRLVPEFVDDRAPVDEVVRRRCRAALGVGDSELLVVGAGIATRRKAPDLFMQVCGVHGRRHGPGAQFLWIGGERDALHWPVRDDARRVGLHGFATMESVPDLHHWLAAADVFLHTARLDAFPLVCLHSAVAGTPVVAFKGAGGTTEMFGDSFLGADYPDLTTLSDVVHSLGTPAERERVARAQGERVRSTYVTDVCAPALHETLMSHREVRST
jgi:glycosyltransferase involved in cell wall biosynthesis